MLKTTTAKLHLSLYKKDNKEITQYLQSKITTYSVCMVHEVIYDNILINYPEFSAY